MGDDGGKLLFSMVKCIGGDVLLIPGCPAMVAAGLLFTVGVMGMTE